MNDSKNKWKETLIEFIFLFVIFEAILLIGMYLVIKCILLNTVSLLSVGLMFDTVKEGIQQFGFSDFLRSYKEVWLFTTFVSLLLAGGSID